MLNISSDPIGGNIQQRFVLYMIYECIYLHMLKLLQTISALRIYYCNWFISPKYLILVLYTIGITHTHTHRRKLSQFTFLLD